jgi:hypothetical protein
VSPAKRTLRAMTNPRYETASFAGLGITLVLSLAFFVSQVYTYTQV